MLYLYAFAASVPRPRRTWRHRRRSRSTSYRSARLGASSESVDGRSSRRSESVLAHARVVDALAASNDAVLPVRFGRGFRGPRRRSKRRSPARRDSRSALERVSGCVEIGLHVVGAAAQPAASRATGPRVHAASASRAWREPRRSRRSSTSRSPSTRATRTHAASAPTALLRAAYLVPRDDVDALQRRVSSGAQRRHPELSFACTGPWPPYSFAALEPREQRRERRADRLLLAGGRSRRASRASSNGTRSALPRRIDADPENVEKGLAQLVLTLIELLRQLMERQALRRMEAGNADGRADRATRRDVHEARAADGRVDGGVRARAARPESESRAARKPALSFHRHACREPNTKPRTRRRKTTMASLKERRAAHRQPGEPRRRAPQGARERRGRLRAARVARGRDQRERRRSRRDVQQRERDADAAARSDQERRLGRLQSLQQRPLAEEDGGGELMAEEHAEESRTESEPSNGHHLGRAAMIAAASGATAYAAKKALSSRSSTEGERRRRQEQSQERGRQRRPRHCRRRVGLGRGEGQPDPGRRGRRGEGGRLRCRKCARRRPRRRDPALHRRVRARPAEVREVGG